MKPQIDNDDFHTFSVGAYTESDKALWETSLAMTDSMNDVYCYVGVTLCTQLTGSYCGCTVSVQRTNKVIFMTRNWVVIMLQFVPL